MLLSKVYLSVLVCSINVSLYHHQIGSGFTVENARGGTIVKVE